MAKKTPQEQEFEIEVVNVSELKPHPRNYRDHPEDQIEHLIASIEEAGFYRNVVVANDGTILAGHGVVLAVTKMGWETVPVRRLNIGPDNPKALKVLAGDNEIDHLGVIDDRALSEILREISAEDDLMGTGYDEAMLANLIYVTRPQDEIEDFDEAAHWVGMPEFPDAPNDMLKITITFRSKADRSRFADILGLKITDKARSVWWPAKEEDEILDAHSLKFEEEE